jgi:hypothetical protein
MNHATVVYQKGFVKIKFNVDLCSDDKDDWDIDAIQVSFSPDSERFHDILYDDNLKKTCYDIAHEIASSAKKGETTSNMLECYDTRKLSEYKRPADNAK